jgi:hypothetical protein
LHLAFSWQGPSTPEIGYVRSQDGAQTFSAPMLLSSSGAPSVEPAMATDGRDRIFLAWWTSPDAGFLSTSFVRSINGGDTFEAPVVLAGGDHDNARCPSVAWAGGDTVLVAWQGGEGQPSDVLIARSTDGGATFSGPILLSDDALFSGCPLLVSDGLGSVTVVFGQDDAVSNTIVATRSLDGGVTWEPPRVIFAKAQSDQQVLTCLRAAMGGMDQLYVGFALVKNDPLSGFHEASFLILSPDGGATSSNGLPLALINDQKGDCPDIAAQPDDRIGLVWSIGQLDVDHKDMGFVSALATP